VVAAAWRQWQQLGSGGGSLAAVATAAAAAAAALRRQLGRGGGGVAAWGRLRQHVNGGGLMALRHCNSLSSLAVELQQ
jgi:hypothetical protein